MTTLKSVLLGAAATVAFASAVQAADPIMPAPVVPVAPVASAFDWNGFYAGARVGAENKVDFDTDWTLGAEIGVNAAFDMFVLGGELAIDYVFADPAYAYAEATLRAGVLLAPEALLYGTVGYGSELSDDGPGKHILAGLGAEFAVTDSVSIDGRYVYGWEQSDQKREDIHKFTLGANFHF